MSLDAHNERFALFTNAAEQTIHTIAGRPADTSAIRKAAAAVLRAQERLLSDFPVPDDEVELWETIWVQTDRARRRWDRIEKIAVETGPEALARIERLCDTQRTALYDWTRRFIRDHAPRRPPDALFELGLGTQRPDARRRHERIEGLYESIKRMGRFPEVRENLQRTAEQPNFGIIYGGGWNVSAYSVLREAARFAQLNAFVAFDHAGAELWQTVNGHKIRVANAGLMRSPDSDECLLATFQQPVPLHFVCPHQWTGPDPCRLGIPVLRSELTLAVTDDKINTTRALQWYAAHHNAELPLITERAIERPDLPLVEETATPRIRAELHALEAAGVTEIVVKPQYGEQERGVAYFKIPEEHAAAAKHALLLAAETGIVLQERVRPHPELDFNWRVLVAAQPDGEPAVVGRFARLGHRDEMEMVNEVDMLKRCGIAGGTGQALLEKLNRVALNAFRAVARYAAETNPAHPHKPLGGGSYALPYFLGIDLIGDAHVMEINGNEVGGLWTDDRLHPETQGRSSRIVLESAAQAAERYRNALLPGTPSPHLG